MRLVLSAILLLSCAFSADAAHAGEPRHPAGHLPFQTVSRIMRTEATRLLSRSTAADAEDLWRVLIERETSRLSQGRPSHLRRSTLRRDDAASPYLICDMESGASGQSRKETVADSIGTPFLMNLYNKDDMTCFAVRSTPSIVAGLGEMFQTIPIVPEMKIAHGTMEAISASTAEIRRIEAVMCPGESRFDAPYSGLEHMDDLQSHGNRRLEIDTFFESRDSVYEKLDLQWHHSIRRVESTQCHELLPELEFNSHGDTFMLEIPSGFRHDCLQMLVLDLALQNDVCSVGAYQEMQHRNDIASALLQSGSPTEKPLYDVGLDGSGQVVALSDSGIDMDNCYFYDSEHETPKTGIGMVRGSSNPLARKVVQYVSYADDSDYLSGHGTHVAGSIAGRRSEDGRDEIPGAGDGVAKAAKLAIFDIGISDEGLRVPVLSTVFATGYEDAGAKIHSASWGSTSQDSYGSFDHNADTFMYEHPDFLFVVAAGNAGRDQPSESIASPALCKNGITVGASQNAKPHIRDDQLGADYLADFSSRGPTADGRRKPDVVAPGMYVQSARADPDTRGECDNSNGLRFKAGTSMSTPLVAGSAALVRQYFEEGWQETGRPDPSVGFSPRASLVKAVILNGASALLGIQDNDTGNVTPSSPYDMNQGFGRVNLLQSLPLSDKNMLKGVFVDSRTVSTGDVDEYEVTIDASAGECTEALTVSLVWTDPPVGPMCEESCVLNDLDLSMIREEDDTILYPNGLNMPDDKNNAERIQVDQPASGMKYTIRVAGRQLVEPQVYSLVITGCLAPDEPDATPIPISTPTQNPVSAPTSAPTSSPTKSPVGLQPSSPDACADTDGSIVVEGSSQTCEWLGASGSLSINWLCYFVDVARTCPSTCDVCHEIFVPGVDKTLLPALEGTTRYFGNTFEMRPHQDLTLTGFDLHLYGSSTIDVEVWTRTNSESWTQICQSSLQARGRFQAVPIPETDCTPFAVTSGTTWEVYVTVVSSKDMIMTPQVDWTVDTADFSLSNAAAVAYFDGRRVDGYVFDGGLRYYHTCQDNKEETVRISDWVGERSCAWLAAHTDRMDFACDFTAVAWHCPATCDICPG